MVGVARRGEVLNNLHMEIEGEKGKFIPIIGDVSDPETIERMANTAKDELGGIRM